MFSRLISCLIVSVGFFAHLNLSVAAMTYDVWGNLNEPFADSTANLICSLNKTLELPSNVPTARFNEGSFIHAISCAKPQDEKTQLTLIEMLGSSDENVRSRAEHALWNIKPKADKIHVLIGNLLKRPESETKISALNVLGAVNTKNELIQLSIAELLNDTNSDVQMHASIALGKIKPSNEYVLMKIVKFLDSPDHRPKATYKKAMPDVNYRAAQALINIDSENPKVSLAIAKIIKESKSELGKEAAAKAIAGITSQETPEEVQFMLAESLGDPEFRNVMYLLEALGKIKPTNKLIQFSVARALDHEWMGVRSYALDALGEIKPADQEILLKIAEQLKDIEPTVRLSAAHALHAIKPKNKEIIAQLKESAVNDPDVAVRNVTNSLLGSDWRYW